MSPSPRPRKASDVTASSFSALDSSQTLTFSLLASVDLTESMNALPGDIFELKADGIVLIPWDL